MHNIEKIQTEFLDIISGVKNLAQLDELRVNYLGKTGLVTALMSQIKDLSVEEKKSFGALVNQLKNKIGEEIAAKKDELELVCLNEKLVEEKIDITLPAREIAKGLMHPLTKTISEVKEIMGEMGFEMADGPEIEDDFHNFTALNIAENHPARQMQDTFYLPEMDGKKMLLRTHTSSVQIRKMGNSKPPMKIMALGKVYRCDSDQTHTPMFHQIEGFYIDKNVNMGNLKWVLEQFLKKFFEVENVSMRFRPSFFPFTEPSAEVDIGYSKKDGVIKIGGNENFLEILGCGMIHPNVLKNAGINPEEYQGFAFGIGIERLAMLKYNIGDLRMFFESDLRFLKHFGF